MWYPAVPAESVSMKRSRASLAASARNTASAVGERQIFPKQTNRILNAATPDPAVHFNSQRCAVTLEGRLQLSALQAPGIEVLKSLLQLCARIHDEWTIADNRLAQGCAGNEQHARGLIQRPQPHELAAREHSQLKFP